MAELDIDPAAPDSGPADDASSDGSGFDEFVASDVRESRKAFEPETDTEPVTDTLEGAEVDTSVQTPVDQTPSTKFAFAGRDYDNLAAAENAFKSYDGRLKATNQGLTDMSTEVRQWREWYDYERAQGRINERGDIVAPQAEPVKTPGDTQTPKGKEPFLEAIDWNLVGNYAEQYGMVPALKAAILQLQDHFQGEVLKGIDGRFDQIAAPQREYDQAHKMVSEATDWLYNTVMRVDVESGEPLYPKLNEQAPTFDPAYSQVFVDTWMTALQRNPQLALSQEGIDYVTFRAEQAASKVTSQQVTGRQVAQAAARDASGRFLTASRAKADIDKGTKPAAGVSTAHEPAATMDEAEHVRRGIKAAGINDREASKLLGIA